MGAVYQGVDEALQRPVALKIMRPSLAGIPLARQRFLREARAAAALEHDHVVTVYHVGEEQGTPYLVMPLLQGRTLEARLKSEPKLLLREALRIGREVAEGLSAAHARGLIHRDVKPANVWLEGDRGRVKLVDFGLARVADESARLTADGALMGTPAYMAPEQARGAAGIDHRCDLFSLGVVLYRMVTGLVPFSAPSTPETLTALVNTAPRHPREIDPAVPPAVSALILRLLAKDPDDRPGSAREVVEAHRGAPSRPALPTATPAASPTHSPASGSTRPSGNPAPPARPAPPAVGGGS